MASTASGARWGGAGAAVAGTAPRGGVASTASGRHPKQGKYLVDAVSLAGRAKQLFPFPRASKVFIKFCVALVTLKFIYWHK